MPSFVNSDETLIIGIWESFIWFYFYCAHLLVTCGRLWLFAGGLWLFVVACGCLLVVCSPFLVACGHLLVVCGCLWSLPVSMLHVCFVIFRK